MRPKPRKHYRCDDEASWNTSQSCLWFLSAFWPLMEILT